MPFDFLVIGSYAARSWIDGYREPADCDLVAPWSAVKDLMADLKSRLKSCRSDHDGAVWRLRTIFGARIEIKVAEATELGRMLYGMREAGGLGQIRHGDLVLPAWHATPDMLMTLKRSHLHHPIHWQKSIADYHTLKSLQGAHLIDGLLATARADVDAGMKARMPSLNMENSDFFRQADIQVERPVEHDELHQRVAYGDRPVFEDLKTDVSKAWCHGHMFEALPIERRRHCIREEAMVIALERFLIPGKTTDQTKAYAMALEKVSTRLMGGVFQEFAIENWPDLKDLDVDLNRVMGDINGCRPQKMEAPVLVDQVFE